MIDSTAKKVARANTQLGISSEKIASSQQKHEATLSHIGNSILLLDEIQNLITLVKEKRDANKIAAQSANEHMEEATRKLREANIEDIGHVANAIIANTSAAQEYIQETQSLIEMPRDAILPELYFPEGFAELAGDLKKAQTHLNASLSHFPFARDHTNAAIEAGETWLRGMGES